MSVAVLIISSDDKLRDGTFTAHHRIVETFHGFLLFRLFALRFRLDAIGVMLQFWLSIQNVDAIYRIEIGLYQFCQLKRKKKNRLECEME